jgi:hypothetical protein
LGPLRNRLFTNSFSLTEFVTSDVDTGMTSDVSEYVKMQALPEIRMPAATQSSRRRALTISIVRQSLDERRELEFYPVTA